MSVESAALRVLRKVGALPKGHFVLTSGNHSDTYVNKDAVTAYPDQLNYLCRLIAHEFEQERVDTVIGPACGGISVAQWTGFHLRCNAAYADKAGDNDFVISRDYERFIARKRVLLVEDILTSGTSAKNLAKRVQEMQGKIVGVGALCNRGGVLAIDLGDVPRLFSLVNMTLMTWSSSECPLCAKSVPVNTNLGHGATYLAAKASQRR